MLFTLQSMIGYPVKATDGEIGTVSEFYFDDADWSIRYMIVETKNWLSGRKVLIAPVALGKPDWVTRSFPVNLTCIQVRNSPDIDTEKPVYRQHETELHDYYQWPRYWEGAYGGTLGITPYPLYEGLPERSEPVHGDSAHLRSSRQVIGYRIHASDGEVGHVEDFVIDDETWMLSTMVVNTGIWLLGRKVLVVPAWIETVNWADASVHLRRTRQEVQNSPEFSPQIPV